MMEPKSGFTVNEKLLFPELTISIIDSPLSKVTKAFSAAGHND